jgi:acyl carrier protein
MTLPPPPSPPPPEHPEHPEIVAAIAVVAREHLPHLREAGLDDPVDPGLRLVEDLELDSISLLTLAVEVENHFRVALEPDDEATITTIGDLAAVVASKLEAK